QEQRAYLKRVLDLKPDNDSAQRALAKMDARAQEFEREDEVIAGVSRKQFRTMLIIGLVAILAVVLVVVVVALTRSSSDAANAPATELANLAATSTAMTVAQLNADATATQAALVLPTA